MPNLESELERLEKLCESATPGPWDVDYVRDRVGVYCNQFELKNPQTARQFVEQCKPNLELIRTSRTALPMLIKKLRIAIEALDRIADPTPSIGRPSFADWELRQMSREALSEIRGEG